MKLYGHPFSGSSRKVQMFCEEVKIPYDFVLVKLQEGGQHKPEFLKLNPNAKVPVIDDDGFVLWESQAILRYLAQKYRAESWYPADLKKRALVDQWMDWNQTRLTPEAGKILFHEKFAGAHADPKAIEAGKQALTTILPVLDAQLANGVFVCGAECTLADLSLMQNLLYLDLCRVDVSAYKNVSRWYVLMKSRPSFLITAPR